MTHFHEKRIIHRDLKLQNILIANADSDFDIKIADFGLSVFMKPGEEKIYHKCGSPGYAAPEMLRGEGYDTKADIFALGSIFYNLLTGKQLFTANTLKELLFFNRACDISHVPDILDKKGCVQSKELLLAMLNPDPEERPSAEDCLRDSWF